MKKLLLILITTILMMGCTSKLITLNEGVSKDTPITFGSIPSTEELVTADEETVITEELAGNKYIITATKGDKVETQEFAVEFDTVDVDGTLSVDMNRFYSNPDKLAKVSYSISEDETVMTITDENGEESHSFDVPVNVIYPEYTIADDITIDTYVGYDINDFVEADEGVGVSSELNENILTITLSKGIWSEIVEKEVILEDSSPMTIHKLAETHGYPIVYSGNSQIPYTLTFNNEDTVTLWSPENRAFVNGTVSYNDNSFDWSPNFTGWNLSDGFGVFYYSLSDTGRILYLDIGNSPSTSPYIFEFYLK